MARVRAALALIGFEKAFPGHLPIIHVQIDAYDRSTLPAYLETAFLAEAPITLATDPETLKWPATVLRVLGISPVADLPAFMPRNVPSRSVHSVRLDATPPYPLSRPVRTRRTMAAAQLGGAAVLALGTGMYIWSAGVIPSRPSPAPPVATLPPVPLPAPSPQPAASAATPAAPVADTPPPPNPSPPAPVVLPAPLSATVPSLPRPRASQVNAATAIKQAQAYMALHDVASARSWYEQAYAAGDGTAAVSLGQTYDADGNHASANAWYDKARAIGGPEVDFALRMALAAQPRP